MASYCCFSSVFWGEFKVQSNYFWQFLLLSLSGCCYPGRRVLVHNKRSQLEITQPQEQVERRPWRERRKGFKDVKAAAYTSANILQDNPSWSQIFSEKKKKKGGAETDRWEGQPVDRPWQLRRSPRAPPAECSESGSRRWRSPLRRRYLRDQQHYCRPWAIKSKILISWWNRCRGCQRSCTDINTLQRSLVGIVGKKAENHLRSLRLIWRDGHCYLETSPSFCSDSFLPVFLCGSDQHEMSNWVKYHIWGSDRPGWIMLHVSVKTLFMKKQIHFNSFN